MDAIGPSELWRISMIVFLAECVHLLDFSDMAILLDGCVNFTPQVLNKTTNEAPAPILVDAYLGEIARGYKVDWSPPEPVDALNPPPAAPNTAEFSLVSFNTTPHATLRCSDSIKPPGGEEKD